MTFGYQIDPASQDAADLRRLSGEHHDAVAAVVRALACGEDAALAVLTDSTGYNSYNWPRQLSSYLGSTMASRYGLDVHVKYRRWSDASQAYDAAEVVRSSSAGERGISFNAVRSARQEANNDTLVWSSDLEIVLKVAAADWTPAGDQTLVHAGGGATQAFKLLLLMDGRLYFEWYETGGTLRTTVSNSALGLTDGAVKWLRVALDVDNGAGGYSVSLHTSDDGQAWTTIKTATGGATTSVRKPSSLTFELGGYGNTNSLFAGTIYEAEIRDGIGGGVLNSLPITGWQRQDGADINTGAPTLTVYNGTMPGKGVSYLNNATRLPKMLPRLRGSSAVIIGSSHNDVTLEGYAWRSALDAWLAAINSRADESPVIWLSENKRTSPATYVESHSKRVQQGMAWARRNSLQVIDTYTPFARLGGALSSYLDDGGVHPSQALGAPLQCAIVNEAFAARLPA